MAESPHQKTIIIAGISLQISLHFPEAGGYFSDLECSSPESGSDLLAVDEEDWAALVKHGFNKCAQIEASYLSVKCSDSLLRRRSCIVHAAAFRDEEQAYLIAAAPGVGKSTQVKTLMDLHPGEFTVICGDRPALELTDDGRVMVHPTPWNGKERWGGAPAAPLAGLIFLARAEQTEIKRLTKREAVIPAWRSLIKAALWEEIEKGRDGTVVVKFFKALTRKPEGELQERVDKALEEMYEKGYLILADEAVS